MRLSYCPNGITAPVRSLLDRWLCRHAGVLVAAVWGHPAPALRQRAGAILKCPRDARVRLLCACGVVCTLCIHTPPSPLPPKCSRVDSCVSLGSCLSRVPHWGQAAAAAAAAAGDDDDDDVQCGSLTSCCGACAVPCLHPSASVRPSSHSHRPHSLVLPWRSSAPFLYTVCAHALQLPLPLFCCRHAGQPRSGPVLRTDPN